MAPNNLRESTAGPVAAAGCCAITTTCGCCALGSWGVTWDMVSVGWQAGCEGGVGAQGGERCAEGGGERCGPRCAEDQQASGLQSSTVVQVAALFLRKTPLF